MAIAFPNMPLLNVFSGSPFTAITLTTTINNAPFAPNFLGQTGLYLSDGVRTTDIAVAERNGMLEVVGTSERGAPPETAEHPKSRMKKATAEHIAIEDGVTADEVQNALNAASAMGQTQLQAASELVNERLEGPFGLRARIDLTHEYHRLGGIKGIVVDKDGSELYNWYDFFGIDAPDALNTNFGALTAEGGVFEKSLTGWKRTMLKALGGLPVSGMRPVALCGDNFFDEVYSNKEVKAARKNRDTSRDSDVFSQNKAYTSFEYGGFTFVNYRGTDDGKVGIDADKGRLFPYGVPGLFQMLFAPPDIHGMTNMKGLPAFAFMPPSRQTERRIAIEAQSNPLTLCVRPGALFELTKTA